MPQALRQSTLLGCCLLLCTAGVAAPPTLAVHTKPVLMPDPARGRLDPVVQGVLLIRIRPEHALPQLQRLPALPLTIRAAQPLLPWQQSLHAGIQRQLLSPAQRSAAFRLEEPLLRTFVVEYSEPWEPEYACKVLQSRCPAVELAEPYVIGTPFFMPNDPLVSRQQLLWTINAFTAWDLAQGDSTVVIGIVDTGVLYTHEDLRGSLWHNLREIPDNGIDDDGNGYVDDYIGYNFTAAQDGSSPGDPRNFGEGHGTGVAGIAAATVNNGKGIAGVAYRCRFFPIKAAPEGVPAIYYGYQGILYCALMGFAVVNCSWGSRTFSCINQSVVEYALARGTAVVAAAGNTPVSTTAWYPAGYPGVIGVGNTYPNDQLQEQSARGIGAAILAPGEGAWTTENGGGYATFGGTSGAAPIVSAAVALVRALHPELTPLQVAALLRRTGEDVSAANPTTAPLLPRRLNLWAALSAAPDEAPGLVLPELLVRTPDGRQRRRWLAGDTLWLWLRAYNALGTGSAVRCSLSLADDPNAAVELLDSLQTVDMVPAESPVEIGPFRAVVRAAAPDPVLLRAELSDSSGSYSDVLFATLVPTPDFITFANPVAAFSIADDGALGFADYPQNTQGIGFRYRQLCGLLYSGGLLAVDSLYSRAVSSAPSGLWRDRDFAILKPFAAPKEEQSLISDANAAAGNRIGLLVQLDFLGFSAESSAVARFLVTAWNISGTPLRDIALGFFMDWDLSSGGSADRVRFFSEALLPESPLPHGAEVVESSGTPVAGACAVALTPEAEIQCAGLSTQLLYDYDGFSTAEKVRLLSSGTAVQYPDSGDVALVVGVRFRGVWEPERPRQFLLCFGVADSIGALAADFQNCVRYAQTLSVPPIAPSRTLQLGVEEGFVRGEIPEAGVWMLELWDLLGRLWLRQSLVLPAGPFSFRLPALPRGIFGIRLRKDSLCWQHLFWNR